jgi:hypothetical protein
VSFGFQQFGASAFAQPATPEPDALFALRFAGRPEGQQLGHFFYEADRGTTVMTDMLKEFRRYHHFIKKHQRHSEAFGIHPVRVVLVETTDEARGRRLMELVDHPLVSGTTERTGLFWSTISHLSADPAEGYLLPRYLNQPALVLDPIWALPDRNTRARRSG